MGVLTICPKCNKNQTEDGELCVFCKIAIASDPCDLYFSVWCHEAGYTQSQPFVVDHLRNNCISGVDNMQDAARFFVRTYDKIGCKNMFFAENWDKIKNMIVYVQDWRGRIAKFKIKVENQPVYYARRI